MKIKTLITSFNLLFFFANGVSQNNDSITIRKLYDYYLTNSNCYSNLNFLTTKIGGRLSGSQQAKKAVEWAKKMQALGAGEILLTSMDRDGTKVGFDLPLTRAVSDAVSIPVIASGGVGNLQDLADGIVQGHADAVLAASIFHYGQHSVQEAKRFMAQQNIPVRLT